MSKAICTIIHAQLVLLAAAGGAIAAVPSSGTLSPGTPLLTYTAGPFTGANPSNNVNDEPDCSLVPGTCDDYMLTIDVPPNYFTLNPNQVVTIRISWPNSTNDFDVYVQNPNTGLSVTTSSTSSNPEIALLDPVAGVFRIRTLVFAAVNESFTGTITLGPRPPSGIGEGQYQASDDVFSCNTHLDGDGPLFNHGQDGEPAAKITKDGVVWVGGIAGVPAGNGLWKVTDACAQDYTFVDLTDLSVGGGDIDIEVATERNPITNHYNIYMSSLWLGNITSVTSVDGGNTFVPVVVSDPVPVNDRQWNAAYGPLTLYLSWRSLNVGNQLFISRSDNAGLTFGVPVPVYNDVVGTVLATQLGNLAADTRPVPAGTLPLTSGPDGEANLYHGYILTTQNLTGGHTIYVAVSKNFGTTWTSKKVFQGPLGATYDHVFSWVAVDAEGNVYTTWSNNEDIYYSFSTNQGDTWSRPIRVNGRADSKTSIFPMVEAGSAGRIIFGWYGTAATSTTDPTAEWHYFHARCNNALDPLPLFESTRVSDHAVKTGEVCQGGLGCGCCRELLELAEVAVSPLDGSSFITYATSGLEGVHMSRQLAGTSAIAGKTIVDRSLTCPAITNACFTEPPDEDPCSPPGITVVTDPSGDFNALGSPAYDILSIHMADPGTGAAKRLVVTMKTAGLDPNNLPPSSVWRVLWFNPSDGLTHFVSMKTCDLTQIPVFDYGYVDPTTNVQTSEGNADAGSISADGSIQITITPSLVGNPQVGTTLTNVIGSTRLFAGAQCSGLLSQIDGTSAGTYTLDCAPVATLLSSLDINEVDGGGVELSWESNAVDEVLGWNIDRAAAAEGPWQRANVAPIAMGSGGRFRYVDSSVSNGMVFYRLLAMLADGREQVLQVTSIDVGGRRAFTFALAGSNPFQEQTMLAYSLGERGPVKVAVYSAAGRRVRTLVDRVQDPGRYVVALPRVDAGGNRLASGVYLAKISTQREQRSVRVVVIE